MCNDTLGVSPFNNGFQCFTFCNNYIFPISHNCSLLPISYISSTHIQGFFALLQGLWSPRGLFSGPSWMSQSMVLVLGFESQTKPTQHHKAGENTTPDPRMDRILTREFQPTRLGRPCHPYVPSVAAVLGIPCQSTIPSGLRLPLLHYLRFSWIRQQKCDINIDGTSWSLLLFCCFVMLFGNVLFLRLIFGRLFFTVTLSCPPTTTRFICSCSIAKHWGNAFPI